MKPIDILFIHPNSSEEIYGELAKQWSAIEPPVWAAMLAKHCLIKGFSAEIMDCEALNMSDFDAIYHIKNLQPRIACFVIYGQQPSASSQNMEGAIRLAEQIKLQYPEIKILFVGGHVSALPKETLRNHNFIDFICQNEGVYTISNLLKLTDLNDSMQLSKVLGLGWKFLNEIILNLPSPIVPKEKLHIDLPGMALDLLPMKQYRTSLWHSLSNDTKRQPFASIYTSLGCNYGCFFCMINIINRTTGQYANESRIFRWWNPEFIIQEFDILAKMGIINIKIADEMFVLNPNHFMKLCELIIERGYRFNIWCYARVDTIKEKYLEIMKKAGINWIALGVESANKKIRTEVIKGQYEDVDIKDVIQKIRNHGINVIANYIFGLPEETFDTMQETLDLALELNTEEVNFYSVMAYPGSPLYGQAVREGLKLPDRYAGYSQHSYYTQNLSGKYLTAAKILKFRDDAWMKYHTNSNYLSLIKNKFGEEAFNQTVESTKIKLKRKILGDNC